MKTKKYKKAGLNFSNLNRKPTYDIPTPYNLGGMRKRKYQVGGMYSDNTMQKSMYQGGGMYSDNTVQGAGQGGKGSTSSIVFQESDPGVLKAKLEAMEAEKQRLIEQGQATSEKLQTMKTEQEAAVAGAGQSVGAKAEAAAGLAGEAVGIADEAGAFKGIQERGAERAAKAEEMRVAKAVKDAGQGITSSMANEANQSLIQEFGDDVFTKTQSPEMLEKIANFKNYGSTTSPVAGGIPGADPSSVLDLAGSSNMPAYSFEGVGTTPPPQAPGAGVAPIEIAQTPGTAAETVGTVGANQAATQAAGRFAAEGVGTGIGKWATSGAGLGTIASLAGTGIKMLSDDKDATTMNFGEGAGSAIAGAGAGMGLAATAGALYGSSLGPVGTAVGAVGGAIYGLGKGLIQRKKARAEKAKWEAKVQARKDKYNTELAGSMRNQVARARAGELAQKTYSGYDLGRNVTYQLGGRLQPLMKYA